MDSRVDFEIRRRVRLAGWTDGIAGPAEIDQETDAQRKKAIAWTGSLFLSEALEDGAQLFLDEFELLKRQP